MSRRLSVSRDVHAIARACIATSRSLLVLCTIVGYTLKCLGSGLFGLRSQEGFIPTMTRLVREAGDADTNGAVCGAMLGARLGYDGLPADWLAAMPNKAWLDRKVVDLIRLMMDRHTASETRKKAAAAAGSSSSLQPQPAAAAGSAHP